MCRPWILKCLSLLAIVILSVHVHAEGITDEKNAPRVHSLALRKTSQTGETLHPQLRHARAIDRAARRLRRHAGEAYLQDRSSKDEHISLEVRQVATTGVVGPMETSGSTIIPAIAPKTPDSLGISQDGTDFSYFSTFDFGSSNKPLLLVIDTGSADTWVAADTCKSSACALLSTFGASDSKTLVTTSNTFDIKYGSGDVKGTLANDTISFAGFNLSAEFGLATTVSDDFLDFEIDGIFGLGSDSSTVESAIVSLLVQQGFIAKKLFGISLSRARDGGDNGVINFGGVDNTLYDGELTFSNSVSKNGLWEIAVQNAAVDGKPVNVGTRTAVVDTGTSLILIPPNDAAEFHSLIPGAQTNGETFAVPCNTTSNLTFTFNDATYTVGTEDYVGALIDNDRDLCLSLISGKEILGDTIWLLGDVFMKNVYSVFDIDNKRVGLAKKPAEDSENSTTPIEVATLGGPSLTAIPSGSLSLGQLSTVATPTSSGDSGSEIGIVTATRTMSPSSTATVKSYGSILRLGYASWIVPIFSFILAIL